MKKIALIVFLTTLIAREPLRFLDEFVEGYFLVAKSKLESSPTVWQDVREGYIRSYEVSENEKGKQLEISLKYFDGKPVIREISRVSKPGMRVYSSMKDMPSFKNNMGITILSTSKGVMTNFAAQNANLGGEILCRVY